jgi:prepilin-type N-terminal cleavage/methylation domain-containing protein/prepilin-type processing-associated H-X9-DG protein
MRFARPTSKNGFSLLELLIVIALIGVLIGLLMPAVQRAREMAARASCMDNLRQIGIALTHYHDSQGSFPPDALEIDIPQQAAVPDGKADLSWQVLILPFIEQDAILKATMNAYQNDLIDYHNPPHTALTAVIPMYACPSDPRLHDPVTDVNGVTSTLTSYIGVAGGAVRDGVFGVKTGCRMADITDGLSNTLLVGERAPPNSYQAGWWYMVRDENLTYDGVVPGPNQSMNVSYQNSGFVTPWNCNGPFFYGPGTLDNACDRMHFWSLHSGGGANFLFADGSARFMSYAAVPIMIPLATKSGHEVVPLGDY